MPKLDRDALVRRLGQHLAVSFSGPEPTDELLGLLSREKVGNVLFFRDNAESLTGLRALTGALRARIVESTGQEPFMMIDEEGGPVSRLSHLAGDSPCAAAIAAAGEVSDARKVGEALGKRLRAAGLNFDMAPVLDVCTNPAGPAAGNRCFGREPREAARYACAFMRGLRASGVLACGKHFPGHGDTRVDSHLSLPVIRKPLSALEETELIPFRAAIDAGIDGIMSAHISFPALEPDGLPATLSRRVLTGLLRTRLSYRGLILTDNLEMKAVSDVWHVEESARLALNAGADLLLLCHDPLRVRSVVEALVEAAENGALDMEALAASDARLRAAKAALPGAPGPESDFADESRTTFFSGVMDRAVRTSAAPEGAPLPKVGGETRVFGIPARAVTRASDKTDYDGVRDLAGRLGATDAGRCPDMKRVAPGDVVIGLVADHPDEALVRRALTDCAAAGAKTVAVSMGLPERLDGLPDAVWKVVAWQYDPLAVAAVARLFASEAPGPERNGGLPPSDRNDSGRPGAVPIARLELSAFSHLPVDLSPARGRTVLAALSGGPDSVCMTLLLAAARKAYGMTLYAMHVNHGLRGEQSDGDEAFCSQLCAALGVSLLVRRVDVRGEMRACGCGVETAARTCRYRALREGAQAVGASRIALAHHMDDQAETVLMHLFRGCGPEGACGMRMLDGDLWRPLLRCRRSQLEAALASFEIQARRDASNFVADNPRNALRLDVLPRIERLYPGAVRALGAFSEDLALEDEAMRARTESALARFVERGPWGLRIVEAPLADEALVRRMLRALCPDEPSRESLVRAAALGRQKRGCVSLRGAYVAERAPGGLYLYDRGAPRPSPVPLRLQGTTPFLPLGSFTASPDAQARPERIRTDRQVLRRAALAGCQVRTRAPGDRIRPLGCGERLLSDVLTDKKIDRPLRDFIPLIVRDGRVLWAVGVCISEEAALRSPDDDAVALEWTYTQIASCAEGDAVVK